MKKNERVITLTITEINNLISLIASNYFTGEYYGNRAVYFNRISKILNKLKDSKEKV